jgi:hypothetical protein
MEIGYELVYRQFSQSLQANDELVTYLQTVYEYLIPNPYLPKIRDISEPVR